MPNSTALPRTCLLPLFALALASSAHAEPPSTSSGAVLGQVFLTPDLAQTLTPGARVNVHVAGCGERMILHPGQSFLLARQSEPCTLESWATLAETSIENPEGRMTWTTRTIGLSESVDVRPTPGETTSVTLTVERYDDTAIHQAIRDLFQHIEAPLPGESMIRLAGRSFQVQDVVEELVQAGAQPECLHVEADPDMVTIDYDPSRGDRILYTYTVPPASSAS